jgi:hypothetical protein
LPQSVTLVLLLSLQAQAPVQLSVVLLASVLASFFVLPGLCPGPGLKAT